LCTKDIFPSVSRPTCRSTLDRYVDRHSADMLVDIGGLSTNMHVGRYSIAKTTTLERLSADTLLTLGRYSTDTWSALSAFFSTQTALVCVAHHNGRHMPLVNKIMFTLDTWHSAEISVEYWPTLPANTPPISR